MQGLTPLQALAKLPLMVVLLAVIGLAMLIPSAHAFVHKMPYLGRTFAQNSLFVLTITVMLGIAMWSRPVNTDTRAGLFTLLQAYIVAPIVMALPFISYLADTSFLNAWFEMVSSLTTTGASVYESRRLPPSLHLWRAIAGWLGGLITLVAASAILAPMNLGGAEVIAGHSRRDRRLSLETNLRILQHLTFIIPLYAGLTFTLWFCLLLTGEHGLTALIHAMGVLSTSGISGHMGLALDGAMGGGFGLAGEALMAAFMLLTLSRSFYTKGAFLGLSLREDPQLRLGLGLIAFVTLTLMLRHFFSVVDSESPENFSQMARAFWGSLFTAASFLTTTGYESAWWHWARDWAGMGAPGLILMGLAVMGGGVATAAGGIKLLRIYSLYLHGKFELEKIVHPSQVYGGGTLRRSLATAGAYMAWVFTMLFCMAAIGVIGLLTLLGMGFEEAMIFTIAALTTTGPLAHLAGSVTHSWAALDVEAKTLLAFTMVLGRVELLAMIALISPETWRRVKQ